MSIGSAVSLARAVTDRLFGFWSRITSSENEDPTPPTQTDHGQGHTEMRLPILKRMTPQLVQAVLPDFKVRRQSNRWAMYGAMSTGLNWQSNDTVVSLYRPSTPRVNRAEPSPHESSHDVPAPTQTDSRGRRYSGLRTLHARHSMGLNWLVGNQHADVPAPTQTDSRGRRYSGLRELHARHTMGLNWLVGNQHAGTSLSSEMRRCYTSSSCVSQQIDWRSNESQQREQEQDVTCLYNGPVIHRCHPGIVSLHRPLLSPVFLPILERMTPQLVQAVLPDFRVRRQSNHWPSVNEDVPPPTQTDSRETPVSDLVAPEPAGSWLDRIARVTSSAYARIRAACSHFTDFLQRNICNIFRRISISLLFFILIILFIIFILLLFIEISQLGTNSLLQ